jgi:hypothetical protein
MNVSISPTDRDNILDTLSSMINKYYLGYGLSSGAFEPFGIQLWANSGARANYFKLERKVDAPDAPDVFFASAPLRTTDHIEILQEFEKLIS